MIVVGVVAALAMWIAASDRRSEAIAGFARAPVGCDTTLDFADTGEYLVFVETTGRLEQIRGDCDVAGEFDVGVDVPPVEITIVDPDGDAVELTDATESVDYADDGFVGSAEFALDISDSNDHVIRVETPGDDVFAVAVGRDPDAGVGALRIGALAVGFAGLLLGLGAIVRGTRRPVPEVDETWQPAPVGWGGDGFAPPGPPVFGEPQGPPSRAAPSAAPPPARPVPTGI